MDTMDAFHSLPTERAEMRDFKGFHIRAFAVIILAVYGLIYMGGIFREITDKIYYRLYAQDLCLRGVLSGIGVVSFPSAKKEILYLFQDHADAVAVKAALSAGEPCASVFMLWRSLFAGSVAVITAFAVFGYYKYRTKKELGGITGRYRRIFPVVMQRCYCSDDKRWNVLLKSGLIFKNRKTVFKYQIKFREHDNRNTRNRK